MKRVRCWSPEEICRREEAGVIRASEREGIYNGEDRAPERYKEDILELVEDGLVGFDEIIPDNIFLGNEYFPPARRRIR